MAENNVGSVMVCDDGRRVGIFTERDYCRKIILIGRSSLNTPLDEIMTKMITVRPDQILEECLELMTRYHIGHLPMEDHGKLVSVVSMLDVMEMIISMKEGRIERLESYILGTDYGRQAVQPFASGLIDRTVREARWIFPYTSRPGIGDSFFKVSCHDCVANQRLHSMLEI